jgi:hypothetical protein
MTDTLLLMLEFVVLVLALGGICWLAEIFKSSK